MKADHMVGKACTFHEVHECKLNTAVENQLNQSSTSLHGDWHMQGGRLQVELFRDGLHWWRELGWTRQLGVDRSNSFLYVLAGNG
jgi:hypothetical protein